MNGNDQETGKEAEPFQQWALVELMGHRRLAGWVTEESRFGAAMLRIDVPGPGGVAASTQWYGPKALYCVTPITEETARRFACKAPIEPIGVWELAPAAEAGQGALALEASAVVPHPDQGGSAWADLVVHDGGMPIDPEDLEDANRGN